MTGRPWRPRSIDVVYVAWMRRLTPATTADGAPRTPATAHPIHEGSYRECCDRLLDECRLLATKTDLPPGDAARRQLLQEVQDTAHPFTTEGYGYQMGVRRKT